MGKFNLTEAAKEILDANVAAKRGGQDHGVGNTKLKTDVAYGTHDAGIVGQSPEKEDDSLPDYLKGTPTATPPGATPPVGSEKDGVGYSSPKGQPQETQGRSDLRHPTTQSSATDYETIRDRKPGTLAKQTFQKNPGATFQSYGEDINALLSGENLSEEFVSRATTIFEAAVIARSEEVIAAAESDLMEQFEQAVEDIKEELAGKIDDYLNYMVQEWVEENQLAIESSLRAEVVESFMSGLYDLFVEHHIDIPEEKVDVVEELATKVEDLEEALNTEILSSIELKKELNERYKVEAIYAACEGLTQTQVEKLKSLAEGVAFTTDEEFAKKLNDIKESYFKVQVNTTGSSSINEGVEVVDDSVKKNSANPEMDLYAQTISRTLIK